jgi:hypothetical protein
LISLRQELNLAAGLHICQSRVWDFVHAALFALWQEDWRTGRLLMLVVMASSLAIKKQVIELRVTATCFWLGRWSTTANQERGDSSTTPPSLSMFKDLAGQVRIAIKSCWEKRNPALPI